MTLHQFLLIAAAVCFLIAASGIVWATINEKAMLALVALGLALLTLAQIFA